jgi:hypothetical protein
MVHNHTVVLAVVLFALASSGTLGLFIYFLWLKSEAARKLRRAIDNLSVRSWQDLEMLYRIEDPAIDADVRRSIDRYLSMVGRHNINPFFRDVFKGYQSDNP